jgi:hypothetical protein
MLLPRGHLAFVAAVAAAAELIKSALASSDNLTKKICVN